MPCSSKDRSIRDVLGHWIGSISIPRRMKCHPGLVGVPTRLETLSSEMNEIGRANLQKYTMLLRVVWLCGAH